MQTNDKLTDIARKAARPERVQSIKLDEGMMPAVQPQMDAFLEALCELADDSDGLDPTIERIEFLEDGTYVFFKFTDSRQR